jgi:hypothetical protein
MKHLLALAVLMLATSVWADSPAQIAADYREKAATALLKVNATLEKATVPLIADLVKSGDTANADQLREQMKAKAAGEPVAAPLVGIAALFKSYDAARLKALEPAQKAAISRIDAMLSSSEGKKLEVVTELGKVREEIEAGKIGETTAFPRRWNYFAEEKGSPVATMEIKMDGTWTLDIRSNGKKEIGTWKEGKTPQILSLTYNNSTWDMIMTGPTATMYRPDSGKRFLKAIGFR